MKQKLPVFTGKALDAYNRARNAATMAEAARHYGDALNIAGSR